MGILILMLALFLISPCSGQHQLQQQQSSPVFRTEVNWIYLNVTVADRDGRMVPGLDRSNLEVYEDGVLQETKFFSAERQPIFLTVLIDVSGSMSDKFEEIRDAVLHVLDGLCPEDTVRVILFSHEIETIENVQKRKDDFMRAFEHVKLSGWTRLYDTIDLALRQSSGIRGSRKAIVVISDGEDTKSLIRLRSLLERTKESNESIYTLGIGHFSRRGLLSSLFSDGPGVNQNVLRRISKVTGGRFYLVAGEHHKGGRDFVDYYCQLILDELKTQYLLAYSPSNPVKDGEWREIKVKVKGKKYAVRTRSGYYARAN